MTRQHARQIWLSTTCAVTGATALAMLLASCADSISGIGATDVAATGKPRRVAAGAAGAPAAPRSKAPELRAGTATVAARGATRVEAQAAAMAAELAAACPVADAASESMFERCKAAMFARSRLRASLSAFTLWGRQHREPATPLKETNLTQFSPDILTGLYLPLFMYDGSHKVEWSESERLWRVELGAVFRNRMKPGQYPYPFWHEDEKWGTYERANAILLWLEPGKGTAPLKVKAAQFTPRSVLRPETAQPKVAHAFDGKWMWTDEGGRTQPKVTLFDGLFRADNPFLPTLETSYRDLALALREGQCMGCHEPSNRYRMKRLVLLQTPAHAAAEIKRVLAAVRTDRMPLDEATGIEEALAPVKKEALLGHARRFEAVVEAARAWERRPAEGAAAPVQGAPAAPSAPPAPVRRTITEAVPASSTR